MGRLILMLGVIVQVAAAAPPLLDRLSNVSIEDLWQGPVRPFFYNDQWLVGPLIVLVGSHDDPDPDETWGIWNDPDLQLYINQEQAALIYIQDDDPEAERILSTIGSGHDTPCMLFRDQLDDHTITSWNKLQWPTQRPSASNLLEWIKDPEQKQIEWLQTVRSLTESLEADPASIQLRIELIEHWEGLGGFSLMSHEYVPWLLLNHDEWYQYEREKSGISLTEDQFRSIVFNRIRMARDQLNLFSGFFGYGSGLGHKGWSFDDWVEKEIWKSQSFTFGNGIQTPWNGIPWEWAYMVQTMRAKSDLGNDTDRDRFVIHALTAEDDEWDMLIERYSTETP